jgi:hypothetical protein
MHHADELDNRDRISVDPMLGVHQIAIIRSLRDEAMRGVNKAELIPRRVVELIH